MNQPYVKKYDANTGKLLNPIYYYPQPYPNRKQRRYRLKMVGRPTGFRFGVEQFIDRGPKSTAVIPAFKRGKNGKFVIVTR